MIATEIEQVIQIDGLMGTMEVAHSEMDNTGLKMTGS